MKKLIAVLSTVLLLSLGCAGVQKPTPEQLANADYGSYPSNYKELTTEYISNILIDPYSAVFSDWRGLTPDANRLLPKNIFWCILKAASKTYPLIYHN